MEIFSRFKIERHNKNGENLNENRFMQLLKHFKPDNSVIKSVKIISKSNQKKNHLG